MGSNCPCEADFICRDGDGHDHLDELSSSNSSDGRVNSLKERLVETKWFQEQRGARAATTSRGSPGSRVSCKRTRSWFKDKLQTFSKLLLSRPGNQYFKIPNFSRVRISTNPPRDGKERRSVLRRAFYGVLLTGRWWRGRRARRRHCAAPRPRWRPPGTDTRRGLGPTAPRSACSRGSGRSDPPPPSPCTTSRSSPSRAPAPTSCGSSLLHDAHVYGSPNAGLETDKPSGGFYSPS